MDKKIPARLALTVALTTLFTAASIASEPPCDPVANPKPDPVSPEFKNALQNMSFAEARLANSHILDAHYEYKVVNQNGFVRAQSVSPELPSGSYPKVYDLVNVTTGRMAVYSSLASPSTSFDQAMAILKRQGKTMSASEKLLYLSMLGDKLSRGYEASGNTSRNLEATFQNLRSGGQNGGICGSIHEYLTRAATALGFQAAGLNSSNWERPKGSTQADGDHFVAYFKDPATGKFYTQNYSRIIDTGKTTVQGAVDVSTQILAPLTGVSSVESKPGSFHMYVPSTARWVEQKLSKGTNFDPKDSLVSVQIGNVESQVALQVRRDFDPDTRMKGFVIHSEYYADDGKYGLDAMGVTAEKEKSFGPAMGGLIDELNLGGKIYGGALQMSAPDPMTGEQRSRSNLFAGAEIKGSARIDQVTGKLSIEGKTIDFKKVGDGTGSLKIRPGVEWASKNGAIKVEAERMIEAVPKDSSYFNPTLKTAYDKVSVILDTRGDEDKAYLVMKGSVYAMEGIDKNAATGLRAQLKAVIPDKDRGDFVVLADASKIVRNPSQDPFYDTPLSTRAGVTWRKAINRTWEFGTGVDVSRNRMNSVFAETEDPVVPGVTDIDRGTRKMGTIWLHGTW